MKLDQRLVEAMAYYFWRPVEYCKDVLRVTPDDWQAKALNDLALHSRVAVRAGHGVGKTAFEAWAMLWFLGTRPFPKVPCTAPTRQQLFDVLWAEAAKWLQNSWMKDYLEWKKTRIVMKGYEDRWFATARTATKPENMAGFHETSLLFIVDEASGVPDPIFETIEGALTTEDSKLLMCGNPTRTSGTFYDAFHKDRALYRCHRVSCLDSPRVTPEYAERLKRKYGENSDVYRVRVLGEFPKSEPDVFIPLELVEAAVMREVDADGPLELGVDVARFGDDETVIAARVGLKLVYLRAYHRQDTMTTAGHVIAAARDLMKEYAKPVCTIKIDDDGVGGGVTDRLREVIQEEKLPISVVDCHNGGKANDGVHYEDWGTEAWAHLRDLLEEGQVQLINDEDLVGQLSTRKYRITSKGRIKLEPKEEMKRRGLRSPDRADAVVLAFAPAGSNPVTEDVRELFRGGALY